MFSKSSFLKFLGVFVISALLAGAMGVLPVHAAGYVVNSLADNTTDDSFCTLREAILTANNAPANANCGAGGVATNDTITFSISGMIILGSTLPDIVSGQGTLTIDGGGTITISGNNLYRVMVVKNGANATLQNLTISNGNASGDLGGGVINHGTLAIMDSAFFASNALFGGGVFSDGTLTIADSAFFHNVAAFEGGGLYNGGTLTITNSVFSSNNAIFNGGGMYNGGTLTIANSAFSGNSADIGGGVYAYNGSLNIANSTFVQNNATYGSGVYSDFYSTLTMTNSTVSQNNGLSSVVTYNIGTLKNTIIANTVGGIDCDGVLSGASVNNLIEDSAYACGLTNGVNGNIVGVDPNLGTLTGSPAYLPLNLGSPAIDAGDNATCAAAPVNNQSQNGVTRPQDGNNDTTTVCDIGSYEAPDSFAPSVTSIVRADLNPTTSPVVEFDVTFSEDVTGVDMTDFTATVTSGSISGASVTGVSGSGAAYTVAVSTGTGSGTLRLDLNASGTGIQDMVGNPIAGGFTSGEEYTIPAILSAAFQSLGTYDGFTLESGENTSLGGSSNAGGYFLYAGDNPFKRQYRSLLHFDTSSLPDTAVITGLTLQVKQYRILGVNPFTLLGDLEVDIASPFFGTSANLTASDFEAAGDPAGLFNPTPLTGNRYEAVLNGSAFPLLNLTGSTQFRLAFNADDNNDSKTNAVLFYSGNYPTASYRPVLIVDYYLP